MRFARICSKNKDLENAWSVLFQSLCKRNYSKRWMRDTKSKTVISGLLPNKCSFPTTCRWGSKQCVTGRTYGVVGNIDGSSKNQIYVYQCLLCDKQYEGETGHSLRVRSVSRFASLVIV